MIAAPHIASGKSPPGKKEAAPAKEAAGSGDREESASIGRKAQASKNPCFRKEPADGFNLDAERAVLGAMMLSPETIVAAQTLNPEHFCPPHDTIFDVIAGLHVGAKPVLPATVAEELRNRGRLNAVGGAAYVAGLAAAGIDSPAVVKYYAGEIIEKWGKRRGREISARLKLDMENGASLLAFRDALAEAEAVMEQASQTTPATILAAPRFSPTTPPPKPRSIFRIGGTTIATPGNIVAITGQAKSGKTALLSAMIAAPMVPQGDTFGFESDNADNAALVHFDTEQSPFDHHAVVSLGIPTCSQNGCAFWPGSMATALVAGQDPRVFRL